MGTEPRAADRVVLAVHGGAGALAGDGADERSARRRAGLESSLEAGRAVLDRGGASVDAVVDAVAALEDAVVFNAGRGAVYTVDAVQELEAAVVDGDSRAAGAAAALRHVRNPVRLARTVLDRSAHVMLVGAGAERFAGAHGVELVDARYFYAEERLRAVLDQPAAPASADGATVGAVAVDQRGRLAAATSTGGVTGKAVGRVGDSPLVGAGTYADGRVAVSTTGLGECFVRTVAAHEVAALVGHAGLVVGDAAQRVVAEVTTLGGYGGLVALDAAGRLATPFDTPGMPRGWLTPAGDMTVVSG